MPSTRMTEELRGGAAATPNAAGKSARAPLCTLADLYDPVTMPPALAKAHAELDRAVDRCYRKEPFPNDRARVEHLFTLYESLTAPLAPAAPRRRSRQTAEGA